MIRRPPRSTLFPTRRSSDLHFPGRALAPDRRRSPRCPPAAAAAAGDRKSTRLNSSHVAISYAVFCLKKKKKKKNKKKKKEERRKTHKETGKDEIEREEQKTK